MNVHQNFHDSKDKNTNHFDQANLLTNETSIKSKYQIAQQNTNMQQPSAADESLRNKIEQGIPLSAEDNRLTSLYKNRFVGNMGPKEASFEIIALFIEYNLFTTVELENRYIANMQQWLVATLQHKPDYFEEEQNAIKCNSWTAKRWFDYLEHNILLSQDKKTPYALQQNAEGITREMEKSIRFYQHRYDDFVPAELKEFDNLQTWVDRARIIDQNVIAVTDRSVEALETIHRKGWNVAEETWYADNHPVWIYRYWRELIGIGIPNQPNYS